VARHARSRSARRARIRRIRVVGLLVVAAIATALGYRGLASSSATASWSSTAARPADVSGPERPARAEADGVVPDGATVFDDWLPGLANLDPDLLGALRRAATDAVDDGVELLVDSGWRSPEYQERLLRAAVSKYGSEREAARWVATPDTSAHVSGDAVDIGPSEARAWLSEHGVEYGLCQIYGNEPWHYELRPAAVDRGCPPVYADPTSDPRLQQWPASAATGSAHPAGIPRGRSRYRGRPPR
jgi:hypothetical protein